MKQSRQWNNCNGKDGKDQQENNRNKKKEKNNSDSDDSNDDSEREEQRMIAQMKVKGDSRKTKKKRSNSCAVLLSVIGKDEKRNTYLTLLDMGTSVTLANRAAVKHCCKNKKRDVMGWQTQVGSFETTHSATVTDIVLPQFTKSRKVSFEMYLFEKDSDDLYDFILGCDFQQEVGIDVLSSRRKIAWDNIEIEMLDRKKVKASSVEELKMYK